MEQNNNDLPPINDFEEYLKQYDKVACEPDFAYSPRCNAAYELQGRYKKQGVDISPYIKQHQDKLKKLWTYTGN